MTEENKHESRSHLAASPGSAPEEVGKLRAEVSALKFELAYLRLQRDALLDMTWLDLPGEPDECTAKWRAEFEKGWMRRAEAQNDKHERAPKEDV